MTDCTREILYSRRVIVRDAHGTATFAAMMIREAKTMSDDARPRRRKLDSQISHQTGARLIASFAQTTEFINWLRAATAVQIIYAQVPTFHACRCQGSGIKTMTKERKEASLQGHESPCYHGEQAVEVLLACECGKVGFLAETWMTQALAGQVLKMRK